MESLEERTMLAVTVTNTNDMGAGSLREAIAVATPGDTINFAAGLNGQTINLASELAVTKSMTIDASSLAAGITISAQNGTDGDFATGDGWRVMNIDDGNASNLLDVELIGLTVTGGDVGPSGYSAIAGGILSRENLTITNSTVSGNAAVNLLSGIGRFAIGGGIYQGSAFTAGTLQISDSVISGNTALADISAATSTENANEHAYGGGIYLRGGDLGIQDSTISSNSAAINFGHFIHDFGGSTQPLAGADAIGGGIRILPTSSEVSIERSTFDSNSATVSFAGASMGFGDAQVRALGGALAGSSNVELLIDESAITNNLAQVAGFLDGDSVIFNTSAEGGGIHVFSGSDNAEVVSSTVSGNEAIWSFAGPSPVPLVRGGGVFGVGNIRHSTVSGNTVVLSGPYFGSYTKARGGGVYGYSTNLSHTIVGNNMRIGPNGTAADIDVSAFFSLTGDYNLIENPNGSLSGTGNLSGDPLLGPLQLNGGPTMTHALLPDSPAIDTGNTALVAGVTAPSFDQRGAPFTRIADGDGVSGSRIDIGAYELHVPPDFDADFDDDFDVDGIDFLIWQRGFGIGSGALHSQGDADFDMDVDGDDLAFWEDQYGDPVPPGPITALSGVNFFAEGTSESDAVSPPSLPVNVFLRLALALDISARRSDVPDAPVEDASADIGRQSPLSLVLTWQPPDADQWIRESTLEAIDSAYASLETLGVDNEALMALGVELILPRPII